MKEQLEVTVLKFGGTSVQDANSIRSAAEIVLKNKSAIRVVVVSAFSGITNTLYEAWEKLLMRKTNSYLSSVEAVRDRSKQIISDLGLSSSTIEYVNNLIDTISDKNNQVSPEKIYGLGEEISAIVFTDYIKSLSQNVKLMDSRDYIYTKGGSNDYELEASYTYKKLAQLSDHISDGENTIYVFPGFISTDSYSRPSVLGRGGSDFSAAILAAGLRAERLEIWTDVSGMLSADPKRIPHANKIECLTYREASELAYFGAKVLHPKTLLPAIETNIPVVIKNTRLPSEIGTLITSEVKDPKNSGKVKAISSRGGITIVNIVSNRMLGAYGFMKKVFEVFEQFRTPVDLVSTTEVSVSVTIDDINFLPQIAEVLAKFSSISIDHDNCSISIVGEGLGLTSGVAADTFGALRGTNVKMVSFGASEVNLSIVVDEADRDSAVSALHATLIEQKNNAG